MSVVAVGELVEWCYEDFGAGNVDGDADPSGAAVELRFADFSRVRDGKLVAHHTYYDQLGLLTQLGLMGDNAKHPHPVGCGATYPSGDDSIMHGGSATACAGQRECRRRG